MTKDTEYREPAIRDLLRASFTPPDLRRFLTDSPTFKPVVAEFERNANMEAMIDAVMDHCRTNVLFTQLLEEIKVARRRQYDLFARSIGIPEYDSKLDSDRQAVSESDSDRQVVSESDSDRQVVSEPDSDRQVVSESDSDRQAIPEPEKPVPVADEIWYLIFAVVAIALALLNLLRYLFNWHLPWSPLVGWMLVGFALLGLAIAILLRRRPTREQLVGIIKDWRTWLFVCIAALLSVSLWAQARSLESTLRNQQAALRAAIETETAQAADIEGLRSEVGEKQAEVTSALAQATAQAAVISDLESALGAREDALAVDGLVKYFDFEESAEGWQEMVKWEDKFKNPQRISDAAMLHSEQIERGVAYEVQLQQGTWLNYTVQYAYPIQADVIVAQFYLPDNPDLANNWVGLAAIDRYADSWLAGAGKAIPRGKWTQVVLDLRDRYGPNDQPLDSRSFNLQAVYLIEGDRPLRSSRAVVGLDEVAWYRDSGRLSICEQRGAGRTLFDFEDEDLASWRMLEKPGSAGGLGLSSAPVYRGERTLKWDLEIEDGAIAYLQQTLRGLAPQGGWVARVYLPEDVPEDVTLWASLYTYSRIGWEDSSETTLVPGIWNTLVWDTHEVDWGARRVITLGIQIGAEGAPYRGSVHVDDVQVFEQ